MMDRPPHSKHMDAYGSIAVTVQMLPSGIGGGVFKANDPVEEQDAAAPSCWLLVERWPIDCDGDDYWLSSHHSLPFDNAISPVPVTRHAACQLTGPKPTSAGFCGTENWKS
jgi:hypothetical protein